MCKGHFRDQLGRPHLSCGISLVAEVDGKSTFQTSASVDFLIDTGADRTCFTQPTANKIGISLENLEGDDVQGIGEEPAKIYTDNKSYALVFDEREEETENDYHFEFFDEINIVPSLSTDILGRDFLDRFTITYSPYGNELNMIREPDAFGDYQVL